MKRLALALAVALFAGCTSIFGIEVPPLEATGALGGESGMEGGNAGQSAGEAGGGSPAAGASGREEAVGGNAGGRGSAGAHNDAGGRAGAGGLASAGMSGATGAGGRAAEPPELGAPCSNPGQIACVSEGAPSRLLCEGGLWVDGPRCDGSQACDHRSGACGPAVCVNPDDHICALNQSYSELCGPDRIVTDITPCLFGCGNGEPGLCDKPALPNLIVEQPPAIQTELAFWPGPTISVCFVNSEANEETQAAAAFVVDEIERKWGRYSSIGFTGWNECTDESTGVKVEFVANQGSPCIDELGGIDRIGYPGAAGSVNIKLCRWYTDAIKKGHPASEALIRLVALHEFGHVLGFDDLAKYYEPNEFMASAINGDRAEYYLFNRQHVWRLQQAYGRKPSGSLVDGRGRCLTVTNGELGFDACDGGVSQVFDFKNGQLWYAQTGKCLHADSSTGAVDLSDCVPEGTAPADEQLWKPEQAGLRGFGGQCLSDDMTLRNCFEQAFYLPSDIEFVDGGRSIRIVTTSSNCAVVVEPLTETDYFLPELRDDGTCDSCSDPYPACTDPDRFKLESDGRLEIDGRCFETPVTSAPEAWAEPSEGAVVLLPCALRPNMYWNLTSRWVNQAGQVLARSTDGGTPALLAHPIEDDATPNDFFDFYWREAQP